GIHVNDLEQAYELAYTEGGLLNGLHIYVGTNFKSPDQMLPVLEKFCNIAAGVRDLSYINIGGGIGIHYNDESSRFDLFSYGNAVCKLVDSLRQKTGRGIRLIFEPGRFLAAPSGAFVTRVTDIKHLDLMRYIVVDASVAVFPRPLHHPESPHQVIS